MTCPHFTPHLGALRTVGRPAGHDRAAAHMVEAHQRGEEAGLLREAIETEKLAAPMRVFLYCCASARADRRGPTTGPI